MRNFFIMISILCLCSIQIGCNALVNPSDIILTAKAASYTITIKNIDKSDICDIWFNDSKIKTVAPMDSTIITRNSGDTLTSWGNMLVVSKDTTWVIHSEVFWWVTIDYQTPTQSLCSIYRNDILPENEMKLWTSTNGTFSINVNDKNYFIAVYTNLAGAPLTRKVLITCDTTITIIR